MKSRFNRDVLNNISPTVGATATLQLIDSIQESPVEVQMFAITAAFKLLQERFNVHPQDAFTVAHNVMNHAEGRRVEFAGVEAYMKHEYGEA